MPCDPQADIDGQHAYELTRPACAAREKILQLQTIEEQEDEENGSKAHNGDEQGLKRV